MHVTNLSRREPLAPPALRETIAGLWARFHNGFDEFQKSKTAMLGAIMLIVMVLLCAAAPWITSRDPIKPDYRKRLQAPNAEYVLGTDRFGRDIYARVLYGGRRLLVIALVAVTLGLALGVPTGLFAGYFGGWADAIAMRIVDGLLAFPGILLFLLFVTLAQEYKLDGFAKDLVLVLALGFAFMPETARLTRGTVLIEKKKEYVEASLIVGNGGWYTAIREILPNCISPLIVHATVYLGFVMLIVAALSYLGLGTSPPTPDWGSDLRAAQEHMETHPMVAVFPGVAISYAVLSFNLLGDGLRDILDPRIIER
jgi:peptide/nickel transport system permease protein